MDYKTFCLNSAKHFHGLARKNLEYSKLATTPKDLKEQAIKDAHKCVVEAEYYKTIADTES